MLVYGVFVGVVGIGGDVMDVVGVSDIDVLMD